jgi:hypothetical protein
VEPYACPTTQKAEAGGSAESRSSGPAQEFRSSHNETQSLKKKFPKEKTERWIPFATKLAEDKILKKFFDGSP